MLKELFCNEDCALSASIPELIINTVLGTSLKEEIETRYDDMRNNFDKTYDEWQDSFSTLGRPFRSYSDTTSICIPTTKTCFPEISQFTQIGLDLPTWINIKADKPVIMFISEEPVRSDRYEKCSEIVASSPFSIHEKEHRECKNGDLYTDLFEQLIEQGFGIYLTQAKKIYTKGTGSKPFAIKSRPQYKEILDKEIELVKPELIILLGAFPARLFHMDYKFYQKNKYQGISTLPLAQPSGAERGFVKIFLKLQEFTQKDVANQYAALILQKLNKKK